MRKFKVTDIYLDYSNRPNDDIYTDDYPKEMIVEVSDADFEYEEVKLFL